MEVISRVKWTADVCCLNCRSVLRIGESDLYKSNHGVICCDCPVCEKFVVLDRDVIDTMTSFVRTKILSGG